MRAIVFLVAAIAAAPLAAQSKLYDNNFNGWLLYNGDHRVHGRWGVRLEAQLRRHEFAKPQQEVLRTGVNYQLTDRIVGTAGYARLWSHPFGDFPAAGPVTENRLYQQFVVNTRVKNDDLQYQVRVEQRWIAERYQNRVRFQLRYTRNLRDPFYFTASNALYLHAALAGPSVFDQNRAYAGWGVRLNRYNRLETGYLLQSVLQRNGNVVEMNHTLQVAVYSTLPFGD